MRWRLATLPLILLVAAGCGKDEEEGLPGDPEGDNRRFAAELRPLNDSAVKGEATLALDGEALIVRIDARGLERNRVHEQAIHGRRGRAGDASCPQGGGSGRLTAQEAERRYGPSILEIEPYPTVRETGEVHYDLVLTVDPDELSPLSERVLVLSGATIASQGQERYEPDLPVACGVLRAQP